MKFVGSLIFLGILGLVIPAYGTIVSSQSGLRCSEAPACTGGPWVNGHVDLTGSGNFTSQVVDPDPFNIFNDSDDNTGPATTYMWTMTFAPIAGTINSATLEIGLWDHDSAAAGDQVSAFTIDGSGAALGDLNTLLNGSGGADLEYNIYTLVLPGSVLTSLADGSVGFSLTFVAGFSGGDPIWVGGDECSAEDPGDGSDPVDCYFFPEETNFTFNGVGLDFARLEIDFTEEDPGPVVPEPSTFSMMVVAALGGFAAWRRRR